MDKADSPFKEPKQKKFKPEAIEPTPELSEQKPEESELAPEEKESTPETDPSIELKPESKDQSGDDLSKRSSYAASSSSLTESSKSNTTKNTGFSKADSYFIDELLNVKMESMKLFASKPHANTLFEPFWTAPDDLLNKVFECLRASLRTKMFPHKGVCEAVKSSHVQAVLNAINTHYLNKLKIKKHDLFLDAESPVTWMKFDGRMDYAVFKTTIAATKSAKKMKKAKKEYFYVVECKAGDPLDGLKQCLMYLKRLKEIGGSNKVSFEFSFFGFIQID